MTDPKLNLRSLDPASVMQSEPSGRVALWGLPVGALIAATVAAAFVWFRGDLFNLASGEARMRVVIAILIALIVVVGLHLTLLFLGAYAVAGRLFRRETGQQAKPQKPLNRDPRLQRMVEELRVAHGWFWRYRLPWLLVTGTDERVEQVAPGLKQAGILHVAETILVHASPGGIEAAKWLGQIRKLRRGRPVDGLVHVVRADENDTDLPRALSSVATALGWAAPVTFLHPVEAHGPQSGQFVAVGAFMPTESRGQARAAAARAPHLLGELEQRTADRGVRLCGEPQWLIWMLELSRYVGEHAGRIAASLHTLAASNWLRAPLAGVMFAPVFAGPTAVPVPIADYGEGRGAGAAGEAAYVPPAVTVTREQPAALLPVWSEIAGGSAGYRGRRIGLYWPDALAVVAVACALAWIGAMIVAGLGNRALVKDAETTAAMALSTPPGTPEALRAQLALQNEIATLEYGQQHGAPWYLRAGLSRNDDLLQALWRPYRTVALRNLREPVVRALEGQLAQLSLARADEQQSPDMQQQAHDRLKAYLMLATPSRVDAPFLQAQLQELWPAVPGMRAGEWLDTSRQLAGFWSDHLKAHPDWRISASVPLVTQMRSTLVNQIGLAASDAVLYQRVLDAARGKYADVSLATLLAGADAHGLFTTAQTVPGIFTRAAWEGVVEKTIDDAANGQRVEGDWVLTGDPAAATISATTVEGAVGTVQTPGEAKHESDDLRQRLRDRYFADYTAAWATMLNSFHWIPATRFSGVIDQLTRLTDPQTSPLLAVMRSVQYQGEAGRPSQALTDTLVRKAQGLLGGSGSGAAQAPVVNPLDRTFGPLLALMGDANAAPAPPRASTVNGQAANAAAFSGASLSRVLTADTTVRLKLQQIQASPDAQAMARALAQAIFQGKFSDLSQARDDAALTAASLGAQWAGFAQTLFVQPLDAAWQALLQPAAASLNEAWRAGVAGPFESSFASRYPFSPTSADASFADLGRYVRPDTGLIDRFIEGELAGVLKRQGDQWVPSELALQSLQFDPAFLAMLRLIGPMGAHLHAKGEARYYFGLLPQPHPSVTRTELTIDGQQVVYFNQQETWSPLAWPGDGLNGQALLTWQTLTGGLRIAFDATGDWAFLRLLEKAQVTPLDETRHELVWRAGAEGGTGMQAASAIGVAADAEGGTMNEEAAGASSPLRYVLRAQTGAGPLELLKLRGFRMPGRIFVTGHAGAISGLPSIPPLPAGSPS